MKPESDTRYLMSCQRGHGEDALWDWAYMKHYLQQTDAQPLYVCAAQSQVEHYKTVQAAPSDDARQQCMLQLATMHDR